MLNIEDVADRAGSTVQKLEELAARIPQGIDFRTRVQLTRSGGIRKIIIPRTTLDTVTKSLYRGLVDEIGYIAPLTVHGFVPGRSTITNAAQHLDQDCVLRV